MEKTNRFIAGEEEIQALIESLKRSRKETSDGTPGQTETNSSVRQGTNNREHKGVIPSTDGAAANPARVTGSTRGVGTNTNGPDNALDLTKLNAKKKPTNDGKMWPYPASGMELGENYG